MTETSIYVWRNVQGAWVAWRRGLWVFGATPDDALAEFRQRFFDGPPALIYQHGASPSGLRSSTSMQYADCGVCCT